MYQLSEIVGISLQHAPISLGSTLISTISASLPKTESELSSMQRILEKPCKEFESRLLYMKMDKALEPNPIEVDITDTLSSSNLTNGISNNKDNNNNSPTSNNKIFNSRLISFITNLPAVYAEHR
jgi:hypothetical protein